MPGLKGVGVGASALRRIRHVTLLQLQHVGVVLHLGCLELSLLCKVLAVCV